MSEIKLTGEYRADVDSLIQAVKALDAQISDCDRVLRASVPECHKGCRSPVGAVQNYICDLENLIERFTSADLDEFAKQKVRRAIRENPDTPVRMIIQYVRWKQNREVFGKYKRR